MPALSSRIGSIPTFLQAENHPTAPNMAPWSAMAMSVIPHLPRRLRQLIKMARGVNERKLSMKKNERSVECVLARSQVAAD